MNLYVTGWTNAPYSYLKVFDVALLLSRWEGFGLAIVEYMAAEKNVVASRVDAIPTLIDDGTDGLLAEADNPEDIKEKVLWLYNHPEEARIMKKKALEKVEEHDRKAAMLIARNKGIEAYREFASSTICGIAPSAITAEIAALKNWKGETGPHSSSFSEDEGEENFVSYQTVFWSEQ